MRLLLIPLLLFFFDSTTNTSWWTVQTTGLDTNLRGVSAAYRLIDNGKRSPVVWASGSNGVILRSIDEGKSWQQLHVSGGEKLDFRGIVAFNEKIAYLMSSGEGNNSRIYKTTDAGGTWTLQYSDTRKEFFLDSIACLSENNCLALSDPLDGKFLIIHTSDGQHWNALPNRTMPAALKQEGAFAASNSSLVYTEENEIYFGTGGSAARVFHSADLGLTWDVSETPITHSEASSGIFALRWSENQGLVAIGGDYQHPNQTEFSSAYTLNNGSTWKVSAQLPGGYRSALVQIEGSRWMALGPNGSDVSEDYGVHWKYADSLNLNAATILDCRTGWAVGPHGTIFGLVNHFPCQKHPGPNLHGGLR